MSTDYLSSIKTAVAHLRRRTGGPEEVTSDEWEEIQDAMARLTEALNGRSRDIVVLTEEELEERLQHSMVAGQASAFQTDHAWLLRKAGECFQQGKDTEATLVRNLAREIETLKKSAEEKLQAHINKSMKR